MRHGRIWLRSVVGLVLLWGISGIAMAWLSTLEPTPQKLVAQLEDRPLAELPEQQREAEVDRLIKKIQHLSVEQRQNRALQEALAEQFDAMSPEQQIRYVRQTMPAGVEQAIDSVLEMEPKRRRRLIASTLDTFGNEQIIAMRDSMGPEAFDAMVVQWLRAFRDTENPELLLQAQPLIEQMMSRLQWRSGRWDDEFARSERERERGAEKGEDDDAAGQQEGGDDSP